MNERPEGNTNLQPEFPAEAPVEPVAPQPEAPVEAPVEPVAPQPEAPVEAPVEPVDAQPEVPVEAPAEPVDAQPEAPVEAPAEPFAPQPPYNGEMPGGAYAPQPPYNGEMPGGAYAPQPPYNGEMPGGAYAPQPPYNGEVPGGVYTPQPPYAVEAPAEPQKKSRRPLIIGLSVGAAVLIAVAVFLLIFFSPNARFSRAMEKKEYDTAVEIVGGSKLKVSEEHDKDYLTLADYEVKNFNSKKIKYEDAAKNLINLKKAEVLDKKTTKKIEEKESAVVEKYLKGIYDSFSAKKTGYDAAVKQIKDSNPFKDDLIKKSVDEYVKKTEQKREELYNEALESFGNSEKKPDEIIKDLEFFGDYRSAKLLIEVLGEVKEGNGIAAAKLLAGKTDEEKSESADKKEDADKTDKADSSDKKEDSDKADKTDSSDKTDKSEKEELSDDVISSVKDYIIENCFTYDGSKKDYADKMDKALGQAYVQMLLGDDTWKVNEMFGSESIHAVNLGKKLDSAWFKNCKGGTGKIAFIGHYLSSTSNDDRKDDYDYMIEDKKDIPFEKMAEKLEDVQYVILYEEDGEFYNDYSTDSGKNVKVYKRTVRVKVMEYPSGKVVYDSGEKVGPAPADSFSVYWVPKYYYGKDPDLGDVKKKVKEAVGLK